MQLLRQLCVLLDAAESQQVCTCDATWSRLHLRDTAEHQPWYMLREMVSIAHAPGGVHESFCTSVEAVLRVCLRTQASDHCNTLQGGQLLMTLHMHSRHGAPATASLANSLLLQVALHPASLATAVGSTIPHDCGMLIPACTLEGGLSTDMQAAEPLLGSMWRWLTAGQLPTDSAEDFFIVKAQGASRHAGSPDTNHDSWCPGVLCSTP